MYPLFVMTIGILLVIWMIMWLRVHAFIALITAAMVVSFLAVEPIYEDMTPETLAVTPVDELPEGLPAGQLAHGAHAVFDI